MTDSQLTRDDTGSDAGRGHLDDLESDVVGQRAAIDEDPSKLIDATLT